MRSELQHRFDEQYKNACFQDDTPVHIWKDSWASCKDYCATRLENHAMKLSESEGYELAVHHLLKIAEELRNEDYK